MWREAWFEVRGVRASGRTCACVCVRVCAHACTVVCARAFRVHLGEQPQGGVGGAMAIGPVSSSRIEWGLGDAPRDRARAPRCPCQSKSTSVNRSQNAVKLGRSSR
jgi:hypothetical protein